MPDIDRGHEFARLARDLAKLPTVEATLQAIVDYAAATVQGAEYAASIMRNGQQRYTTVAATGDLPLHVDAIQYRTAQGPCLEALAEHRLVRTDDLANDARWRAFGRLATDATGVSSMLSHPLFIEDHDSLGALNLYSRKAAAFAALDLTVLDQLITHCSVALANATVRRTNDHLRVAIDSNREIGAAMGVLMATRKITREQAFDLLRIASQRDQRKLRDIASDVTDTGILPGS